MAQSAPSRTRIPTKNPQPAPAGVSRPARARAGRAEEIIGRWLAARPGRRELVVLATKGRFPTDESPNGHGLSAGICRWLWRGRCAGWTWRPSICTRCTPGTR